MKTALINAQMVSILGLNCFGKNDIQANWIHHGLGLISSYAKGEGFDIELIDLRKCRSWRDFSNRIESMRPDVVGLSMTSLDYYPVMKSLQLIKKIERSIITVVGGIHPSVCLEDIRDNNNIDYIIQGEGEISFTELLQALAKGYNPERVIVGKKPDLDALPFVDREIFDYETGELSHPFRSLEIFESPFVTMISSRGCYYNCKFCQPAERKLFGKKVRRRSVGNFLEEIRQLYDKYKFRSLFIHDDCFTENEQWTLEFCERYQGYGFTQPFYVQSRADIICKKEKMIKKMAEVGLCYLSIGFESGSQRLLNFLGKGTTVRQNIRAAEICRKYDIKIGGNFMLGIPTETKEEVMETIKLIKTINPYEIGISHFTPYPGSYLYNYCLENKLLRSKDYNIYHNGINSKPKIIGIDYRFLRRVENEFFKVPYIRRVLFQGFLKNLFNNQLVRAINGYMGRFNLYVQFKKKILE